MKKLKPVFLGGTASDVGKSVIATGFCRIFLQDGYAPAPFKAQNMSLNSYATHDGLEIGRAQAVQAEACKLDCNSDMNPVLLKPTTDTSSQIVLHGKPFRNQSAYAYFSGENQQFLFEEVTKAFDRLASRYNPVVMEGAGSIAEINLKHRDIVNMRMAAHAGAVVYLIADIERGGVFASIYGSLQLLPPEERKLVKGIIINKFRGDIRLFDEGRKMIEELTHVPVIGVIPSFQDIYIDPEDSVALKLKQSSTLKGKINIAIVAVRQLSNFTDFELLEQQKEVNLFYAHNPSELFNADILILPGSKSTIADLQTLQRNGMDTAILEAYRQGKTVIGICGGYQMMGLQIEDPYHVESDIEQIHGLGLLPVKTVLTQEKTTQQVSFRYKNYSESCKGYEIHMGVSSSLIPSPLAVKNDGTTDGYMLNHRCWGTYLHGIFDNARVISDLLSPFRKETTVHLPDMDEFKQHEYDKLADFMRKHLDISLIYEQLTED